jgi:hypothetical protein
MDCKLEKDWSIILPHDQIIELTQEGKLNLDGEMIKDVIETSENILYDP